MIVNRYAAPQRWIHWAVAGLVAAAYALAEFRGWFPRGTPIRRINRSTQHHLIDSHFRL